MKKRIMINTKIKCPSCHFKNAISLNKHGEGRCSHCDSGYNDIYHSNTAKKRANRIIGT